jgi:hypothetical protein
MRTPLCDHRCRGATPRKRQQQSHRAAASVPAPISAFGGFGQERTGRPEQGPARQLPGPGRRPSQSLLWAVEAVAKAGSIGVQATTAATCRNSSSWCAPA